MRTQELLDLYHQYIQYGNPEGATQLVDENRDNKRFVSMIELRRAFLRNLAEKKP